MIKHWCDPLSKDASIEYIDSLWRFSNFGNYPCVIRFCPFCGIKLDYDLRELKRE